MPSTTLLRAEWGYIDRATPARAHLNPAEDALVGAGDHGHLGRSYFKFDLATLRGADVLSAGLTGKETKAKDCAKRAVQVVRTEALTAKSSWLRPPKEHEVLATGGPGECLADPLTVDLTAAVKAAVQRGDGAITFELRVPAEQERDSGYGRRVANDLKLVLSHNKPPAVPTDLLIDSQRDPDMPCAPTAPGVYVNPDRLNDARAVVFRAKVTDPDPGDVLEAEYATWPVADPAARQSVRWPVSGDGTSYAQVVDWYRAEGIYAWTVRAHDGTASSAETAPCYLTVDRTLPSVPAVSSTVYPPRSQTGGGYQFPGDFTFTTTSSDVAAYSYRFDGRSDWTIVRPIDLGGPVTISYTPPHTGYSYVTVYAIDRAGNYSSGYKNYEFDVFEDRPFVFSARYPESGTNWEGGVGVPGDFRLSSNLPDIASYTYSFNGAADQTVAVDAERKATVTFTPTKGDYNLLKVHSTSSTGAKSPVREHRFMVDSSPVVTFGGTLRIGSPVDVDLKPRLPGTVEYTYWFTLYNNTTTTPVTVRAAADGTGKFTWTPSATDYRSLHVRGRDAAGADSVVSYTSVYVDGAAPYLTVTGAKSPGVEGKVALSTTMVNPVEYEYYFTYDRQTKHTAAAGPDGRATATFIPPVRGTHWVIARARNAAGIWSAEGSQMFSVDDTPTVTSAEFPTWPAAPWRTGSFTLKANQPNATEFAYTIDGVAHTTPVGPDGKATFEWTPTRAGSIYLVATTRTATGEKSLETWYSFTVTDVPTITSPDYTPGSNVGPLNKPGTFSFASARPGITEYVYTVSRYGSVVVPETTVAAPQGTASTTFAPAAYGDYTVRVASRTAAGQLSEFGYYSFSLYSG